MTPRAAEVLAYIRARDLSPFAAFGPVLRDQTRAFVGGGVINREDYKAVIDTFYTPAPIPADAIAAARNRAHLAHDASVKRRT